MESNIIETDDTLCFNFTYLNQLIEELYVPEFINGFEVESANCTDYSSYLNICDKKFSELNLLINSSVTSKEINLQRITKCLASIIILNGEHSSVNVWATDVSRNISKILLDKFISFSGYRDVCDTLTTNNCFVFILVLKKLRVKLLKDSWKKFPAAVICYSWLLHQIETPYLEEHFGNVLPTALILVDDFVVENRKLGIKCLEHIIRNVGKTNLCWYSHDEVILKALEPLIYFKEEELIEPLISALITLLKKKYPQNMNVEFRIDSFDNLINTILHNMMFEQRLQIRSAYIKTLPQVIEGRGLGMLVHSIALFKVIDEYVLEPTSTLDGLDVLMCFLKVCWPRVQTHFDDIFLLICKIYIGIQYDRYPDTSEKKLLEIIGVLRNLCPEKLEKGISLISKHTCFGKLQTFYT